MVLPPSVTATIASKLDRIEITRFVEIKERNKKGGGRVLRSKFLILIIIVLENFQKSYL